MPDPLNPGLQPTGAGRRLLRGGSIVLFAQGGKLLLQLGTTIVLARLLAPEVFGLFALLMAFTSLLGLFQGLGLSPAIVQAGRLRQAQLGTLFWLNLGFGLCLMILLVGCGPLLAWLSGDPRLPAIAAAAALTFPVGSAAAVHRALLIRQLRVASLVVIDLASMTLSALFAISLALAGAGVWSLVLMPVAQTCAQVVFTWQHCSWRPGRPVRGSGVRPLLRFGGDLLAVAVIAHAARQLDKVAIGIVYGATALGYYSRAWQIYLLPASQLLTPLFDVVVPTLSRLVTARGRYLLLFVATLAILTTIAALFGLMVWCHAEAVVGVVLGPGWEQATLVLRLLAPGIVVQPLLAAGGWALTSLGETRAFRRLARTMALGLVTVILLALPFGPAAVAAAISFCNLLIAAPLTLASLHRCRPALGRGAMLALTPALLLLWLIQCRCGLAQPC